MIVKRYFRTRKREEFMKTRLLNILFLVGVTLLLANCSNGGDDSSNTAVNYGYCTTGQVYTSMGCLTADASVCGSTNYGYWTGGNYNGTYYSAGCYPATSTTTTSTTLTCNSTDYVQTAMGSLQQGSCSYYCSQYGKRYGYYNGMCYPALY